MTELVIVPKPVDQAPRPVTTVVGVLVEKATPKPGVVTDPWEIAGIRARHAYWSLPWWRRIGRVRPAEYGVWATLAPTMIDIPSRVAVEAKP